MIFDGLGTIQVEAGVAARAGVSKGGLLYHFPSKEKLLEAVVEHLLHTFSDDLTVRETHYEGELGGAMAAFIDLFERDQIEEKPPASGILLALVQNPGLLEPIRRSNRMFLDRMKQSSSDPDAALVVYLALQGMRNMQLLNMDVLTREELAPFLARLKTLAGMTCDNGREDT